ncbi:Protein gts1 [Microsporum ferrugineum]
MSALSKRQQARNERTLQDLITSVPGNDRCADCQARNPGWGSWNLGIFLCMRCATLHRKLGTHISKVKSLTMDSWTADQVEVMKKNGNIAVNRIYNPRNVKPSIPIDIDEVDSAMERFVRKKYELRALEDGKPKPPSRQDPSYTSKPSVDFSPSPAALPSKPRSRFGFGLRSISSSHLSTSSDRSATSAPSLRRRESLETQTVSLPNNKQSRTLGVSIADHNNNNGSLESKLERLRDMGFMDEKRNMTILKGLNGDVERCIDTLTRLGEKSSISGSRSPTSPTGTQSGYRTSSGSTDRFTPPSSSSNPFDKLPASVATTGTVGISINRAATAGNTPVEQKQVSHNPFDALDQSFQNLQVSSQQPLFPNMTGGYPSQQGNIQLSRPQQSMTPPVPTMQHQNQLLHQQQQHYGAVAQPQMNGHYNPFISHSTPVTPQPGTPNQTLSPTNPFFTQMQQQQTGPQQVNNQQFLLQHHNTMPALSSSYTYQQPQQQQQIYAQQPAMSAYQTQLMQQQPQQPPQFQQPQKAHRIDKSSILALYNFSQPPPTIPEQPQQQQQQQQQQLPHLQTNTAFSTNPYQANTNTSPMVLSAPATTGSYANHNPFFTSTNSTPSQPASMVPTAPSQTQGPAHSAPNNVGFARTHVSQESIDIRQAHSGRHSPDIFASLSARY